MVTIRTATHADRGPLVELHVRSIRELAPPAHSPAEVDAWASYPEPSIYPVDDSEIRVFVAEREGEIAGFAELDVPGAELARCYVDPDHAGEGVGRALFDAVLDAAEDTDIDSLYVESSRNAVGFYERMGFERTGTHEKKLTSADVDSLEATVVDMEQRLDCDS